MRGCKGERRVKNVKGGPWEKCERWVEGWGAWEICEKGAVVGGRWGSGMNEQFSEGVKRFSEVI